MSTDLKHLDQQSITTGEARLLATTTKTPPQMGAITPRYLLRLLPWVQVQSGTYRVNRVKTIAPDEGLQITFRDGKAVITPEALKALPEFADAEMELVTDLANRFSNENIDRDQAVFSIGDACDKFYVIARGAVEISTTGPHNEKLQLAVLGCGDHFGESSLLDDSPERRATARALTDCELLVLSSEDFADLMNQVPAVREALQRLSDVRKRQQGLAEIHGEQVIKTDSGHEGERDLTQLFVEYETEPEEYPLSIVQSILRVHTRVSDLYNEPLDQLREQLRLTIEGIREKQEWELINNPKFGLLAAISPTMKVQPRYGTPTPDDLDQLLSRVWKKPAFFLAHPRAIAAIGRECTWRGVPPATTQMLGATFITWRGIPIIPCDKIPIQPSGRGLRTTDILLMRTGEEEQGVVGLHQAGIPGEVMPSLSVRFMSINQKAVASYLVTKYFSCACLTADALGVLENVVVDYFHGYEHE